jgi:hypothetical protein
MFCRLRMIPIIPCLWAFVLAMWSGSLRSTMGFGRLRGMGSSSGVYVLRPIRFEIGRWCVPADDWRVKALRPRG